MKNSLFLLGAAAVVALSSCSQSEVMEVAENRAIGFENFVGKATKAGETTNESIKKDGFGVYGGTEETNELFSDVKVYYSEGWTYDDTKYWMPDNTYKFAAYAPQVKRIINPTWDYTNNKLTFDITCDAANQNDLVYGVATPVTTPADLTEWEVKTVEFEMSHLLSKLNFVVKAGDIESDAKLKIEGVTIKGNLNTQGKYDTKWTPSTPQDVTFTGNNVETIVATGSGAIGTFYVIPQTLSSDVTVKFTATLTAGNGVQIGNATELTATITTPTWQEDYVYTYVATVNQKNITGGTPIEFSGSVSEWTGNSESEILDK